MDIRLCNYSNSLGRPNEGIHTTRIPVIDVALWDVVGLLILTCLLYIVALATRMSISYPFILLSTSVFTVFIHWLFCVDTTVNKYIFGPAKK